MKALLGAIIWLLLCWTVAHSMDVMLQWNANKEPNLAGYKMYYKGMGVTPWIYHSTVMAPATTGTISGLSDAGRYLFAVTAFNNMSTESGLSNIVKINVPSARRSAGGSFRMR